MSACLNEQLEPTYQKYKEFLDNGLTNGEALKKLHLPYKAPERKYIKNRVMEDKWLEIENIYPEIEKRYINGEGIIKICSDYDINHNDIRYNLINKKLKENRLITNKQKKKKPKSSTEKKAKRTYTRESIHTEKAHQMVKNSEETLQLLFLTRNIKQSTQKGYIAAFIKYCEYTKDKYNNLQEMVDFYLMEEDKRIPMRERRLKKDLIGFREYLLNDAADSIKSDRSFKTYFSKVKTIFNHFELEMPKLPQMKIEKGYVSNYNDLPTHDMIRTACEQSPVELKSVILFMSSSGSAKAETLSITVQMFLEGCSEYCEETPTAGNIDETLKALSNRHDIVPMIYLRRIKTDKWYYTYCSPEASYMIIESLKIRKNVKWDDKLFDFTSSLLLVKFQDINDNNGWGLVGKYRRFRSHALRKFMASNIGLARDQVDSIQGRSKDQIQEAYFKQDPKAIKDIYMGVMHRVMVYDNWGYGTSPEEFEKNAKKVVNGFKDETVIDVISIPKSHDEIIGVSEVNMDKTSKLESSLKSEISSNADGNVSYIMNGSFSVAKELLLYSELLDKGLLSIGEFNAIKIKLLKEVLN